MMSKKMDYIRKFIHTYQRSKNRLVGETFAKNEEERLSPIIKKPSNMVKLINMGHGKLFSDASEEHPDGVPTKLLISAIEQLVTNGKLELR